MISNLLKYNYLFYKHIILYNNIMDYQNIYDLEDKINLIYDFIYNINTANSFLVNKITLGKISINDIKISLPNSNNQDEIIEYNKNKNNLLDAKFKLIKLDGNLEDGCLLKRYSDQFSVFLKIKFYIHKNEINSFDSHINNDSLFSYLLSELVLSKKTTHILLPILNLDIKYYDIEKIIYDDLINQKIKTLINNNTILDICCLQLREQFFKTRNLEDYLKEADIDYKLLLFQIIHTLCVIQNEFEGFRHNNLILKNIFIYLKKNSEKYVEYDGFNNNKFYVTNVIFDIKITNFEYSIIPKFYGLFNYKNKTINQADTINPYYDIYIFLNDLWNFIKNNNKNIDNKLIDFFNLYLPINIRNNNIKQTSLPILVKPSDLLYDIYFKEYLTPPTNIISNDTPIIYNYLTGNQILDSDNSDNSDNTDKKYININTVMDSDNISVLGNQKNILYNKYNKKSNINIMGNDQLNKRIIKKDKYYKNIIRKNNNITNIRGGGDKPETLPSKIEKNTPFISNEQRKIQDTRNKENPIREPPVLLEQKIYDTSQKPQPKSQFPPTFIPLYDQDGTVMNNILPYSKVINQPPVQKVYNVSLANPLGNYSTINRIYEDIIPGDPFNYSATTIFERSQLIDFLRNNILEFKDGEEMTITGGKNSLLSHIKLLDVNPYTVKKNPYMDLPRNFLLYRAAYPIRFDEKSKAINIAKSAMGINIRIYMMTYGDLNCKKINFLDADNFDLWREIKYYDWIRNVVIKRKISPNFISPILYKIDSQSKLDWNKLDSIKSKGKINNTIIELQKNQQKINDIHNLEKKLGLLSSLIPSQWKTENQQKKSTLTNIEENKIVVKEDITANSGKILILLTEAPTTNIIQWSSCIYESYGSIKKMITTGYHTPDVWKSILFQLIYSLAVLQEKIILFNNLSLENNIYIKDIYYDSNSIGSWIYKINNLDYYIPNYGYILIIDSKYSDIEIDSSFITKPTDESKQRFKIYGNLYEKNSQYNDINFLKQIIMEQFKNLINPDNFGYTFKVKGGSIPDDIIMNLLRNMWNNSILDNIRDYLHEYFCDFLHNRIGTPLYKSEKENLNLYYRPDFNKCLGCLMAWQKRYQEYEWVLYFKDSTDGLRKEIIRKEGLKYIHDNVFTSSLYSYPENEKILPETTKIMKYDEFHIYETYILDNLTK